jgi:hypothetical protein
MIDTATSVFAAAAVSKWNWRADAEHQQDDANFGELLGQLGVRDESWRIGPHEDACNEVPQIGERPTRCVM